uniref:Uncharacterized protein n=1 Tax=Amazona collaria TaxID=241587 RepID=A0A8B9GD11_9PSIT
GVGRLDVVQVLDGLPEGGEHLLAVGTDLGVANDGRGAGQVPKGGEEPLCPGVDDQQPGLGSAFLHVDLAPEAGNELLLLGCPVHHGVGGGCCGGRGGHGPVAALRTPRRLLSPGAAPPHGAIGWGALGVPTRGSRRRWSGCGAWRRGLWLS